MMENTALQAAGATLITVSAGFVHIGLSFLVAGIFMLAFGIARGLK